MADFQSQAMGLTGLTIDASSTAPSRAEFSTFLNDGVIDVTNRILMLRPQDINDFTRESDEQTSNASLDLNGAQIISVVREDGVTSNNWRPCRKIFTAQQYVVTDVNSLHFSSKFHPAYMVGDNGIISVFPAPGSDPNAFKVYYVNNVPEETDGSSLDHASTGIKYFPKDKVYLVVLYASIQSLMAKMTSLSSALPSDITLPSLPVTPSMNTTTLSIPSFTAPDAFVQPVAPAGADIDFSDVPTAPTYVQTVLTLGTTPTISDLSISAVSPVTPGSPSFTSPDVSSIFSPTTSPPSYTAPVLTLETAPTISDLTISAVAPVVPSLTTTTISESSITEPTFTPPVMSAPDFGDTNTWISTEEDSEMLS